jgi:hypothetical protein
MPRILTNILVANTSQQITGSSTFFRDATFFGIKSFSNNTGVSNTSTVYFGINSGECALSTSAGLSAAYTLPTLAERDNLANWWFQSATTGDGLYIIYH